MFVDHARITWSLELWLKWSVIDLRSHSLDPEVDSVDKRYIYCVSRNDLYTLSSRQQIVKILSRRT
jgi:hypothetical protein